MNENNLDLIKKTFAEIRNAEEKFRIILDNPELNSAEYGLTNGEQEILEKLITYSGEGAIAAAEIAKRVLRHRGMETPKG